MKSKYFFVYLILALISCQNTPMDLSVSTHDLVFSKLPSTWDEGIPLGNGMLGVLIWQKEGRLRFSLDRADLWDLRPMENLDIPEWKFRWVQQQWRKNTYEKVQDKFDRPYNQSPAPTKIPGGAMEFELDNGEELESIRLYVHEAVCEAKWKNGMEIQTFVHATNPIGWFKISGIDRDISPEFIPPQYQDASKPEENINSLDGQNLMRLGYKQGFVQQEANHITYIQEGWGGFKYTIEIKWKEIAEGIEGCWTIQSYFPDNPPAQPVISLTDELENGFLSAFSSHEVWWDQFWQKSSIQLPDTILEKQWYLEQYKFGSAARADAPPISLQAVWTADNGKIPPWKGDFHHDLNTQLSYWPAYSGNHLDLEIGFINWMWNHRETFKKYTNSYYEKPGLNVPGVSTLTGEPMGGWIQYSFGPTVSGWLAHHFYLHWIYTKDREFLENRAYPWLKEVALFYEELSLMDENGKRKLPLSSSPEIFNNSREAWFEQTTNFDLAIIRWTLSKAAELASELDKPEETQHWNQILDEWPDFQIDDQEGLLFARNTPYHESHRHFSHLMAIHPFGLIEWDNGPDDQNIIRNTIDQLDRIGPSLWTGYSYSWLGNLKARAKDGEGAAEALRIFAEAFCLPNSFHVNGDQSGKGYSNFTYRPFTLEGNFAFASGIQEMLLQSHTDVIHLFPAIPDDWSDISFTNLRAVGAFLISAKKENGKITEVHIKSEQGGELHLKNPFESEFSCSKGYEQKENMITLLTEPNEEVQFIIGE